MKSVTIALACACAVLPVSAFATSAETKAKMEAVRLDEARLEARLNAERNAAAAPTATLAPIALPAGTGILRAGTSVPLRLVTGLTTEGKKLSVGHRFELETSEAVKVNGATVIPAGSRAMGEVTQVRNKGMWGKSGGITARLLYVSVEGRQLRLSGSMDDKGVTGTVGVVAAVALVPVVGFFVTGTSAKIPVGTNVTGFLEEDVPVAFAAGVAPAPLTVAPAAVPVAAPAPVAATPAVMTIATEPR